MSSRRPASDRDRYLRGTLGAAAVIAGSVVVFIFVFVALEAWPALARVGARFITDDSWHPAPAAGEGAFGLAPMVAGTMLAAFLAMVVATPLGLLSALFSRYYAPRLLAAPYRRLVELLAGIPSVVYGFWGLVVLVPLVRELAPPGASLFTASLILGVMILPTIALFAEAAVAAVPSEYLNGASALALSRWTTIKSVVLPAARGGILTGLLLGLARAIGETMAVLMVAGNVVQVPGSLFDPVRTLTANIALEMAYATEVHRSALFVTGLILLVVVALLVIGAEAASRRGRAYV